MLSRAIFEIFGLSPSLVGPWSLSGEEVISQLWWFWGWMEPAQDGLT